jgi:hypothetical protein
VLYLYLMNVRVFYPVSGHRLEAEARAFSIITEPYAPVLLFTEYVIALDPRCYVTDEQGGVIYSPLHSYQFMDVQLRQWLDEHREWMTRTPRWFGHTVTLDDLRMAAEPL